VTAIQSAGVHRAYEWSAYAGAALAIIGNVALLVFYALELPGASAVGGSSPRVFGPISDYSGLLQYLVTLPLPLALHQLVLARDIRVSQTAMATGIAGLSVAAIAQALLVAKVIDFSVNFPSIMGAFMLIGVWLVLANRLAGMSAGLPTNLARLGRFVGFAFAILGAGSFVIAVATLLDSSAGSRLAEFTFQHTILVVAIAIAFLPGLLAYVTGTPILAHRVGPPTQRHRRRRFCLFPHLI
jgi:hypothetical protein